MARWECETLYNQEVFCSEARELLRQASACKSIAEVRERLTDALHRAFEKTIGEDSEFATHTLIRSRDCMHTLQNVLLKRSEERAEFSIAGVLWDAARGQRRDDLTPAFWAELIHWVRGLYGRSRFDFLGQADTHAGKTGREAAIERSNELDSLWGRVQSRMARFTDGLAEEVRRRREANKERVLQALGGRPGDWNNWLWHTGHIIKDAETLGRVVKLSEAERDSIAKACRGRLPFGVTPYYASLMDEDGGEADRAVRAQVIPPPDYVRFMLENRDRRESCCDFMLEADTSPINRITRRYPAIVILKPYNTCPQICVYCQRNWEIEEVMAPDALAPDGEMDQAIRWIADHEAVHEVLITGGDPMVLDDAYLEQLLGRLAGIEHVDLIRIGTRTPVTLPMRITERLASMLGGFRELGRRELAVITHVEHAYEITPEMAAAVDRLRRAGLSVYNQQVFTFYVSRRFESARLRMLLRRIGIEPYYTFVPKGKQETGSYRVPIARILQEQKEEVRLLPGMRRTDAPVYNIPGLGKNHLRAAQHRDLLSVLPDGSRVYEFHPWEKNIVKCSMHIAADVPILDYLVRLADLGENLEEYASIWYYF